MPPLSIQRPSEVTTTDIVSSLGCPRTAARISRGILCLVISAILIFGVSAAEAAQKQKLAKNYQEWLERDAAYIITKEEHDAFLRLTTDDDRDKFIQQFWELRNPTPGLPDNTYEEEIYRRIAYANAHFGTDPERTDGERTVDGPTSR